MMYHATRFDDSPVVPPVLNGQRTEDWKTRWRRLTSAGVNIDKDHFVVGRTINGRWVGVVR